MYEQARKLFQKSLDFHIRLMGLDYIKHKATEEVYTFFFDLMHDIGEKNEAMGRPIIADDDCEAMIIELYEDTIIMKSELDKAIKAEKNEWAKNLLIGKLDSLQQLSIKVESLIDKN